MTTPISHKSSSEATASSAVQRAIKKSWRWLLGLSGLVLAWYALKGVAWTTVWELLNRLSPFAILVLVVINLLIVPVMTARWWLLLRALGEPVGLLPTCAYRIAANAVNYLTPGPHFGGEPLSVYLLHHRQKTSLSTAATSVAVDRLLELLASFLVLGLCLIALTFVDSGPIKGGRGLFFVIAVLVVLTWTLSALFTGRRPLSGALLLLIRLYRSTFPPIFSTNGSLMDIIIRGETMAETLFREHRCYLLLANFLSLGHWFAIFAEFWLMAYFLGFPLSFSQLTAVVVVARLAFFTPLPAGIGVLETALPWMTATLGLGSGLGLSLCLIIRFRDILFSLVGLGLTMKYLTCQGKVGIINVKS
ncbi:lysylphosphatidylglycerol synthase transmembrane domain-containing protein [Desulforhopalus sp. IMCC35007]|uniref:lysylphosphatidylglycerol synthase transmembrane domain-containing protein n=1 Tax=Desulforhopalus sp. IMCC35007 TaxID=2569543 RepID=UPI0010ADFAF8|nr:lysylphosphatidylglycerol synthase transmembrane domain-containing protein [Desulforhopalus sp. IMCC35007]TKB06114.1 flippase-like domain-containing protein [Desulforhopalus sp. IMCC35007]